MPLPILDGGIAAGYRLACGYHVTGIGIAPRAAAVPFPVAQFRATPRALRCPRPTRAAVPLQQAQYCRFCVKRCELVGKTSRVQPAVGRVERGANGGSDGRCMGLSAASRTISLIKTCTYATRPPLSRVALASLADRATTSAAL